MAWQRGARPKKEKREKWKVKSEKRKVENGWSVG
jgi:hypothetical protein